MKRIENLKNNKGMTFMELIVYLGVFSVTILTLLKFSVSVMEWQTKTQGYIEIENTFTYINRSLKDTFQKAVSIDDVNSIYSNNNGKVVITTATDTISYYLSGTKLIVNRASGGANDLTDSTIKVTSFNIEKIIDKTNKTIGIRLNMNYYSTKYPTLTRNITTSILI